MCRRQSVAARHRRLPGTETLGEGEAEAILLAKEVGADILLTDDRKARAAAVSLRRRVLIGHRQTVL
jgi:predicted nucleic acid-binding protein